MTAVLVIDAASPVGGVGFQSQEFSVLRELPGQRRHAEAVIPLVIEVMEESGASWGEVDGIGVSTGPGSFTGIRVGLAAAQGLATARDIPLAGVGSLNILARACYDVCRPEAPAHVFAVQDVRRGEVAIQSFSVTQSGLVGVSEMNVMAVSDPQLETLLTTGSKGWVSGDGGCLLSHMHSLRSFEPKGTDRARALASLTQAALKEGRLGPAVPVYARPANATPPKSAL